MELNKSNIKKLLGIITFAILLYVGLQNLNLVMNNIAAVFGLIFPFLLGAAIAFILNVPMRSIETKLFTNRKAGKIKWEKLKRPISLILTLLMFIGIILIVVFLVIPEIVNTIPIVSDRATFFIDNMEQRIDDLLVKYPSLMDQIKHMDINWEQIGQGIFDLLRNSGGNFVISTIGVATSILGGVVNFFLGLIFAIYILMQKEKLGFQVKKLLYAYLPEQAADRIVSVCHLSGQTFARFLSGQCLEAVILGMMFFIAMIIFRFPYALMISVLIGFLALIPIFGSFIGCFIGAFLILIMDPTKAFWFIIMFIIIQQIEGNFIYPRVVGGSVGLPSMWVLVAVTIGGSTMGIAGMLIFIPLTSVVYTLLREAVNRRLIIRKVNKDKLID
ncbi:MAG: family transporter [Herbinix sp.]|jgi:predicted PurR-regulated permease PerM|nr:family transporter [Herbinix sp.]